MVLTRKVIIPLNIALLCLSACGGGNGSTTDSQLRNIISAKALTGDIMEGRAIPDIATDAKAQLGMKLFFSKSLGGDRDSACVSCHFPTMGGGDGLSLPVGVGAVKPDLLGLGRVHNPSAAEHDGGPPVPRNAPTIFNLAGWDSVLFHDGRIESIGKTPGKFGDDGKGIRTPEVAFGSSDPKAGSNLLLAQTRFPVTSKEEMKGFNNNDKNNQQIRDFLAARLGGYGAGTGILADSSYWLTKFRTVFEKPSGTAEELITEKNIASLLGLYEASQSFVDTPWKAYIEGDDSAISKSAKNGALLFYKPIADGGADCASCHSGDFFSDEGFHNIAMPQMGRGKGNGDDGTNDFGRFTQTGSDDDLFAFRTPTLLNVEVTGPWSHAGAYTSLEAVVRHHLDPATAVISYDVSQLTQTGIQNLDKLQNNTKKAVDKLLADRKAEKDVIKNVSLSDNDVDDLLAFLKALTDPCVKDRSCMAKWIVDPDNDVDPNGDQLSAVDANGNRL